MLGHVLRGKEACQAGTLPGGHSHACAAALLIVVRCKNLHKLTGTLFKERSCLYIQLIFPLHKGSETDWIPDECDMTLNPRQRQIIQQRRGQSVFKGGLCAHSLSESGALALDESRSCGLAMPGHYWARMLIAGVVSR